MKRILFFLLLLFVGSFVHANHIKGGFFTYRYLGPGTNDPSKLRYELTLTVYMECNPPPSAGQLSNPINFTIFDGGTNTQLQTAEVLITNQYVIGKNFDEQCITGNQQVCFYTIVEYKLASIELSPRSNGYTFSYQRCCRIQDIINIANSSSIGNTYSITIPGTNVGQEAEKNSSPVFQINDTVVVCANNYFEYSFLANDPDNNTLRYELCDAWEGGGPGAGQAEPNPSSAPPYGTVPYTNGFTGASPLGSGVTINPNTGLISGVAPGLVGEYVITVCINEFKNNVLIGKTRKELHIKVGDCTPVKALLDPEYTSCDGFTITLANKTPPNNEMKTYYWEFGDGNTSTQAVPTHTYADTGVYKIKLVINRGDLCSDSTTALVKVFPGFFPGFTFSGICVNKPTQFTDTTKTRYGVVNTWSWNFGDASTLADTSHLQNPVYTYTQIGDKIVTLIVTNSKGCIKTYKDTITIIDKPVLSVAFKDTLICTGDNVQLQATGIGNFTWTPNSNITNANTATPTVNPPTTQTYYVELNDNGCINRDSVRVRAVSFISLQARGDTTICFSDSVQLNATTNGLRYQWAPASEVNNSSILNPMAKPSAQGSNTYTITAFLGGCAPVSDDVIVTTVPYPTAIVSAADDTICYDASTQLTAITSSNNFTWSPLTGLTNANTLTPTAGPLQTTSYILTVTDPASGCPKPSRDTVVVNVLPPIPAFAGSDTSVVVGQTLQFNASGGVAYLWSPSYQLSDVTIPDPRATYPGDRDSVRYKLLVYNEKGCEDSAFVTVRIFKTFPQVFVPTGFTPNGDGKNDVIRPIAVGIEKIEYFRIYNRWGQLVFSTTINGQGWDGKIKGKAQGTNVFVWIVKAIDYTGKSFFAKGTVTLIQ